MAKKKTNEAAGEHQVLNPKVDWGEPDCNMNVMDLPLTDQPVLANNTHGPKYMWCEGRLFMADGKRDCLKWVPAVCIPGEVLVELMRNACIQKYKLELEADTMSEWVRVLCAKVRERLLERADDDEIPGVKPDDDDPLEELYGVWRLSANSVLVCCPDDDYVGTHRINGKYVEAPETCYPLNALCGLLVWFVNRMEEYK